MDEEKTHPFGLLLQICDTTLKRWVTINREGNKQDGKVIKREEGLQ